MINLSVTSNKITYLFDNFFLVRIRLSNRHGLCSNLTTQSDPIVIGNFRFNIEGHVKDRLTVQKLIGSKRSFKKAKMLQILNKSETHFVFLWHHEHDFSSLATNVVQTRSEFTLQT